MHIVQTLQHQHQQHQQQQQQVEKWKHWLGLLHDCHPLTCSLGYHPLTCSLDCCTRQGTLKKV